ncbi:ArsC/Spx/MgsR family protein [Lactococcus garvieae]|uniref:ArsC/Spx/MgsR family protein n=1 Tax=Lactococcus garvieae TaxID=1363 RepID=UPI00398F6808
MITIYQRSSCSSSKKAMQWFDFNQLTYEKKKVDFLSREQLIAILSLTENGLEDIIKTQGDSKTRSKVKKLTSMTFNDALFYIQTHSEVLRTPIILSQKKLLVGFNNDDIRQFIPHHNRAITNA